MFIMVIIGYYNSGIFGVSKNIPIATPSVHLDHVIDNVYLGNWKDSVSSAKLKYNNIKCMLTLNEENVHTKTEKKMFDILGINYKYIQIQDSLNADILPYLNSSIAFIKKCKDNIFVHCSAGVSRSVSVVIAYLMKEKNMSFPEALGHVQKIRPIANPNPSFVQQLKKFKESL